MSDMPRIDATVHRAMVWTGPVVVAVICIGCFCLTGFLPPPNPQAGGREIADLFIAHKTMIRLGCLLMMIAFAGFATWAGSITVWTRRAEPGFPVLTYASIACIGVATVMFEVIPMTWAVAAFRPEEIDPNITRVLNDWVWFAFLYSWPPFAVWEVLVAIGILRDRNATPVLPRWVAYVCIWDAILISPAGLMSFTKQGPFAFNGLIALWIPFTVFFAWMCVISVAVLQAIGRQERLQAAADRDPALQGIGS